MKTHTFGRLSPVSSLTLGGGGLGMLWGPTTFDECVATVHDAVAAGINLLDLAPRYGDGKAGPGAISPMTRPQPHSSSWS
jgi:aryl-alcohol dehydrogenase-like predicted oxidoreductase